MALFHPGHRPLDRGPRVSQGCQPQARWATGSLYEHSDMGGHHRLAGCGARVWVSWGLYNRDSVVKGRLRAGLAQSPARGHPGGPSVGRLWLLGKAEEQRRVQGHKASCHGAVTRVPWAKQLPSQAKVRGVESLPWNRAIHAPPPTRGR